MEREKATKLLNEMLDGRLLKAKDEAEKEIEKVIERKLAETKSEIMRSVDYILGSKTLAGKDAILEILDRAAVDTDFLARLAEKPDEALREYGLTWEEKAAITSGDIQQIEDWVGELTPQQRKWLQARTQQEKW
ncbi:MAG: hypothetical protein R6U37_00195 [Dehalococcoidia bacterium]